MKNIDKMRRNVKQNYLDNSSTLNDNSSNSNLSLNSQNYFNDEALPMESINERTKPYRFENTIEAKVEEGDTLQALALRFHCSVSEIKRLNKLDKDNEIHARKVIKIPVTVHTVLLAPLPTVQSNNNSPPETSSDNNKMDPNTVADDVITVKNPLEDAEVMLVAAVNSSRKTFRRKHEDIFTDADATVSPHAFNATIDNCDSEAPLLTDILEDTTAPDLRPIPGPSLRALNFSGSDCDMSWICLLILILALCFVIPLVYVIYLAEHPHPHPHHHNTTNFNN